MPVIALILPRFKARTQPRKRVPSGLLSFSSKLSLPSNYSLKVIDAESLNWNISETIKFLQEFQPSVFGVSVCSPAYAVSQQLVESIRGKFPEATIIVGGKFITHYFDEAKKLFRRADVLVRGDGENVAVAISEAVSKGKQGDALIQSLQNLPNVGSPNCDSSATLNPDNDLQDSGLWPIESLHPPIEYYQGDRMLIEFSRGCIGNCSYCLASRERRGISFRPKKYVLDSIENFIQKGFNSFFFTDDDLAGSPEKLRDLLKGIIDKNYLIEFDANVRPDSLVRCADLAPLFRKAGCRCLWLGIESGSRILQNYYKKGFSQEVSEKALEIAFNSSRLVRTNWILGAPIESLDTISESISFASHLRNIGPHIPHISYMVPYPGTPVFDDAVRLRLVERTRLAELAASTHSGPVMETQFLSKSEIENGFYEFHQKLFSTEFLEKASKEVATESCSVLKSADLLDRIYGKK